MSLKSKFWFLYRWIIWIKDNFFDIPKINKNIAKFSFWDFSVWDIFDIYKFWNWKESILYIWWMHWNEIWTVKLMNKWINYLSKNKSSISKNKSIYIIACLNLDWYNKALLNYNYFSWWIVWKTNWNNVDLNRNFPTLNWSENSKLFVSGKYYDISWWTYAWSEKEIKFLLDFIKIINIKTIYVYHNCWWTVMWTFTASSDLKVLEYSKLSNYKIFTHNDFNNLKEEQKSWHWTVWWIENNLDYIEVELKSRWWSEWWRNKKALINSIK